MVLKFKGLARERCSGFLYQHAPVSYFRSAALQCATCRLQPCSLQPCRPQHCNLQPRNLQPCSLAALQPATLQPAGCNPACLSLALRNLMRCRLATSTLAACSLQPAAGSAALAGGLESIWRVGPFHAREIGLPQTCNHGPQSILALFAAAGFS